MDILRDFALSTPAPAPGSVISNTSNPDDVISLEAFGDMLSLYAVVLSLCSVVALINYHRLKFPLPISLSLSGLMMSIVLVAIDAAIPTHPIRSYVGRLLVASDFDEIILRFGIGFIMFASAMESDIRSLNPHWGLVFLLSVSGVIISIVMCAAASLALFLGFGYFSSPVDLNQVLVCVLFGAVVGALLFLFFPFSFLFLFSCLFSCLSFPSSSSFIVFFFPLLKEHLPSLASMLPFLFSCVVHR